MIGRAPLLCVCCCALALAGCTAVTDFTPSPRGDASPDGAAVDCEPTIDGIPAALERCNGLDDDCDGEVDEGQDACDPILELDVSLEQGCVLRASGRVQCWGNNQLGQLGRPTDTHLMEPGEVQGLSDAVHISLGATHSCALRRGGAVSCWGSNAESQLGVEGPLLSEAPIAIEGVADAREIAAGGAFTCVLEGEEGAVLCWGGNDAGQLGRPGDNDPEPRQVPGVAGAVEVVAGAQHACVRLGTGEVSCWGCGMAESRDDCLAEGRDAPHKVEGLQGAAALAAGRRHSCALLVDGQLSCWGENLAGQLGIDSFEAADAPQLVELSRWIDGDASVAQVSAGGEWEEVLERVSGRGGTTCVVLRGGATYCWGSNDLGQLGIGSIEPRRVSRPMDRVGGGELVSVAVGQVFVCGLDLDGIVWCWGAVHAFEGLLTSPRELPGL